MAGRGWHLANMKKMSEELAEPCGLISVNHQHIRKLRGVCLATQTSLALPQSLLGQGLGFPFLVHGLCHSLPHLWPFERQLEEQADLR